MTHEQLLRQRMRLQAVPLPEWQKAHIASARFVTKRLRATFALDPKSKIPYLVNGMTRSGAHSEHQLGDNALYYYPSLAIEKLYNGDWEWKEGRSLAVQLIIIINALIQQNTKNYTRLILVLPDDEDQETALEMLQPAEDNDDKAIDYTDKQIYQMMREAVGDDPELLAFIDATEACAVESNDNHDNDRLLPKIRDRMGITEKQGYNLMKRLKRKVNKLKQ